MKPLKTGARSRTRVAAIAGASAIALLAPFVTATTASAATAPTYGAAFSVAQIANDGVDAATLTLTVDNSAADSAAITPVEGKITVTLPAGLVCTDIGWTVTANGDVTAGSALGTPDAAVPTVCAGTLTFGVGQTITAGTKSAPTVAVTVDGQNALPYVAGPVKVDFSVVGATGTLGSASATVNAVNPAAPQFVAGAVPAPVPGKAYSYQIVNPLGIPATAAAWKVFSVTLNANGSYNTSAAVTPTGTVFTLDNGITFDSSTGKLASTGKVTANTSSNKVYTIIANASGTVATADPAGAAAWVGNKPVLAAGDIASTQFMVNAPFSDYSTGSVFGKEVYALVGATPPVIEGYSDGTFGPEKPVSRQAFAAFTARTVSALVANNVDDGSLTPVASGVCTSSSQNAFPDVPNNSEFCLEINWLYQNGITTGYADGGFHPAANISRQAIAAFLHRIDQKIANQVATSGDNSFADVPATNQFQADIEWLADANITTGYADGGFHPTASTSRQAAATFFYRYGNAASAADGGATASPMW